MRNAIFAVFGLLLSACADGGVDLSLLPVCPNPADCVPAPPAQFSSWSAVPPSSSVSLQGSSRHAEFTHNFVAHTVGSVATPTVFGAAPGGAMVVKTGADGSVTNLSVRATDVAQWEFRSLGTDSLDSSGFGVIRGIHLNGSAQEWVGRFADAVELGLNYQSFGVWQVGWHPSATTGKTYTITVGAQTAGSAVPTTGTASFSGVALGYYVAGDGTVSPTAATMSASADFAAHSIGFSTTQTTVENSAGAMTANPALNLSGSLGFAGGSNQFSGNVSTIGGGAGNAAMTGSADGYFYGPAAHEIGGVFWLTGGGPTTYTGAFGGKRP